MDRHTPAALRHHDEGSFMFYAILCYDSEAVTTSMSEEEDGALMGRLAAVQDKLARKKKLGPVGRLMPTDAAITLRKGRDTLVVDGPFAETKEQLLGFYVVDCDSKEEAVEVARELAQQSTHGTGAYEIRPLRTFKPGSAPQ
jgi:hypothetical protein